MKVGDLVKIKNRSRDQELILYDDVQFIKLQAWIYLENYSPPVKFNRYRLGDEIAIVLEMKDVYKDGDGIDIMWDRFVKIITSSGIYGWIQKDYLTKFYEDD